MTQSEIPQRNQSRHKLLLNSHRLALILFCLSLAVYLLTRLIRLPDFPIYFFTDEAIQTQHAADLIANNFRSPEGIFLPTYFENGGQYNLSLSVYIQVLPTLIFGKSIWVTRGVSVLITLIGAISMGLILKNIFQMRSWWLGTLLLTATPTWFLHSRTAFETVIMASMYAAFLYFYLRYRDGKPKSLLLALLFGALAFYAYSPGQVIVVVTGLILLIIDARYHWKHRKTALIGLVLLILLAFPYLRFLHAQRQETIQHLALLNSYWVKPLPIYQKVLMYLARYLKGFNPLYWFWPNPSFLEILWPNIQLPSWLFSNQLDLVRHTMKGYGHILPIVLPIWVLGLTRCIRHFKKPAYRTLIIATLAAPSGAAVVDWGITRGMVFIIPTILIAALGLETCFTWLKNKWPKFSDSWLAVGTFLLLSIFSVGMLGDALINGPTWYKDYGLGGMQYGGKQVFERAAEIALEDPKTTVLVSSTWANGPDILMRYFIGDFTRVAMGNINAFGWEYRPLDRNILFVMTEEDLVYIHESGKFTNITIVETLPYPDDRIGFYFVRLEYVPEIEAILAAERAERQALLTTTLPLMGQDVQIEYPALDMNEIQHIFDGDPHTVIRTLEANPLRVILTFPEPIPVTQVTLLIGGTPTIATVTAHVDGLEPVVITEGVDRSPVTRDLVLQFTLATMVNKLEIEVLNPHDGEIAHVHLWEVIIE